MKLAVTAGVLNVRAGAGTEFPVLARVLQGAHLDRVGETTDGRWIEVRTHLADGSVVGWVSSKYVKAVDAAPHVVVKPRWLQQAEAEIGIAEYPGPADNPRVVEYHSTTTMRATDDEVPWCSSFMNWCMKQAGVTGTRSAAARSWLGWGQPLNEPTLGCVVIFTRGHSQTQGHVALFVRSRGAVLDVLGGNQSNQVKVAAYPRAQVLGFRWPAEA